MRSNKELNIDPGSWIKDKTGIEGWGGTKVEGHGGIEGWGGLIQSDGGTKI